jgi:hypothetical protein
MHILPSAKGQMGKRRQLAEEMWILCRQVCPIVYKDMQRVGLMEYWDEKYFEEAFYKVTEDFIAISCFGMELKNWDRDRLDRSSLKDRWLRLRVVLAKYMDKGDERFAKIEEHYNFLSLRGLPKITPAQRPKRLPRKWWDDHPKRDYTLNRIALIWWRLSKAPQCDFEDICGADVGEDENDGKTKTLTLERALGAHVVEHEEDVKSPIDGLRHLL